MTRSIIVSSLIAASELFDRFVSASVTRCLHRSHEPRRHCGYAGAGSGGCSSFVTLIKV